MKATYISQQLLRSLGSSSALGDLHSSGFMLPSAHGSLNSVLGIVAIAREKGEVSQGCASQGSSGGPNWADAKVERLGSDMGMKA